ncbi:hypothetical protein KPZU09_14780 [Klebsiella pneumoniae]|uniref:Uncharacterized protein n=1 Tax=Klebsiella pneumoniae TaxID=573 RepID=A0A919HQA6_KLEPN|nr:hypothetical protein KPZU09_14780 [Klebsiella pneumoniae]
MPGGVSCWRTAPNTARSLFNIAPLASLTDIVTDAHLPDKTREALEILSRS